MSADATQVGDASGVYSATTEAHEVPSGYKWTEVGVIPEDWETVPLAQLSAFITKGATPTTYGYKWEESGILFLRSECVSAEGLDLVQSMHISSPAHEALRRSAVHDGDILITITGYVGRVVLLKGLGSANINQHIARIRIVAHGVDAGYVYQFLSQRRVRRTFESITTGQAYPQISLLQVRAATVALPREPEQRAIAEALADVDELLGALEALIAKKRAIKQGAMQQLLTGKTRLPGFSVEWERKRIGDLLNYERPDRYIVHSAEYTDVGDVPVLTANKTFVLGYTDESFGVCQDLPVIIFDDFTTDSKYVTGPFKVKSSAIKLLRARHDRVSLRFVFERMQLIRFPLGDHKRYYISEYQNVELLAPDCDEQLAIASILSGMDAEISALERRRDKTRAIKQGMMQQLLTGRVRLVRPAQAEASV